MPGERPYLTLSREQINRVAKQAWADPFTLRDLVNELDGRSGPEPDSLRFKLIQRIAEIDRSGGRLRPSRSPELPGSHADSKPALLDRIGRLGEDFARAQEQAASLEAELAAARAQIRRLERELDRHPSRRGLYGRVGLDERCPDFVLAAVRKAYRKRFHPDHHPGPAKVAAETRFKEAEAVFDQLFRLRGGGARSKGPEQE